MSKLNGRGKASLYLTQGGHIATIVNYGKPIEVVYYAINLGLFEGLPTTMHKSGNNWCVQFRSVDEYEIKMKASTLAAVTSYYNHKPNLGFSQIQRVEPFENGLIIKPTPNIDILPGQHRMTELMDEEVDLGSWEGDSIPGSNNILRSRKKDDALNNHIVLVDRLLSLKDYDPAISNVIPIPVEYLLHDKIPLVKHHSMSTNAP